jgi:hypothetical protein
VSGRIKPDRGRPKKYQDEYPKVVKFEYSEYEQVRDWCQAHEVNINAFIRKACLRFLKHVQYRQRLKGED